MNDLYHHGIKGMHWGIRRFQNADGTLTAAGRKRYDVGESKAANKQAKRAAKAEKKAEKKAARAAKIEDAKETAKAQAYKENVSKNWYKAYNKATEEFNAKINDINAKYSEKDLGYNKRTGFFDGPKAYEYAEEVGRMWTNAYKRELISMFGEVPMKLGEDWLKNNAVLYNTFDPEKNISYEKRR